MTRLMEGERVLWEGRPAWRAVARDVVQVGWIAAYLAALLVANAMADRLAGFGLAETLRAALPFFGAGLVVLPACIAFAYAIARTTHYTLTNERCILRYGVALTATLSLPLRRIAAVSVAVRAGGFGDVPLRLRAGSRMRYLKLWPHARPWRYAAAEPMLRGVPDAVAVAALLSHAVAQVTRGVLHPAPDEARGRLSAAILAAGD